MCVRWFLPYVPFLNSENELCNGMIKEGEGAFEVTCFHRYFISEEDRTPKNEDLSQAMVNESEFRHESWL